LQQSKASISISKVATVKHCKNMRADMEWTAGEQLEELQLVN
jgi:hypothetical protein